MAKRKVKTKAAKKATKHGKTRKCFGLPVGDVLRGLFGPHAYPRKES